MLTLPRNRPNTPYPRPRRYVVDPELTRIRCAPDRWGGAIVTTWSVLTCKWEGMLFKMIINRVTPTSAGIRPYYCADVYATSLSSNELNRDEVLLVYKLDGTPLDPRGSRIDAAGRFR